MTKAKETGRRTVRDPRKDIAVGMYMGALLWVAMWSLSIQKALAEFDKPWGIIVGAGLGALVYLTRARKLLWVLGGLTIVLFIVVALTPVFPRAARGLVRRDVLRKADAVVVLSSSVTKERKLDTFTLSRMVDGMRLVRDGWADTLVRTEVGGPYASPAGDVADLARLCDVSRVEVIGRVNSTRDEAVQFAELARRKGWKSAILVTSPYHSARAAAAFRRAGVDVISAPCSEREFSPSDPTSVRQRLAIFRWWSYEQMRWILYRARGWV